MVGDDIGLPRAELDEMVDYIYAVGSTPVYMSLREREWTTDQYATWFVRLVERLFLNQIRDSRRRQRGLRPKRDSLGQ
jgi:hypothetical protein